MDNATPTASSYGSQVLTSGDLCVRSASSRNKVCVYTPGADASHLCYVTDAADASVTECSRVTNNASGGLGRFAVGALEAGTGAMAETFASSPQSTVVSAGGNTATLGQTGLSFDSDECAIYFGKDRTFRIMYVDTPPARLVFQCIDAESGLYTTKFSCVKDLC